MVKEATKTGSKRRRDEDDDEKDGGYEERERHFVAKQKKLANGLVVHTFECEEEGADPDEVFRYPEEGGNIVHKTARGRNVRRPLRIIADLEVIRTLTRGAEVPAGAGESDEDEEEDGDDDRSSEESPDSDDAAFIASDDDGDADEDYEDEGDEEEESDGEDEEPVAVGEDL